MPDEAFCHPCSILDVFFHEFCARIVLVVIFSPLIVFWVELLYHSE